MSLTTFPLPCEDMEQPKSGVAYRPGDHSLEIGFKEEDRYLLCAEKETRSMNKKDSSSKKLQQGSVLTLMRIASKVNEIRRKCDYDLAGEQLQAEIITWHYTRLDGKAEKRDPIFHRTIYHGNGTWTIIMTTPTHGCEKILLNSEAALCEHIAEKQEKDEGGESLSLPTHTVFCIAIPDETFDQDLALAQEAAVFAPFGRIVQARPMVYGEVGELARRYTQSGETACLFIDQEQQRMVDLSVDLALFVFEHSGKKPICMYIGKDAFSEKAVTVKYSSSL